MDATSRRELDQLERALVAIALRLDHDSQAVEAIAARLADLRGRLAGPLTIFPEGPGPLSRN